MRKEKRNEGTASEAFTESVGKGEKKVRVSQSRGRNLCNQLTEKLSISRGNGPTKRGRGAGRVRRRKDVGEIEKQNLRKGKKRERRLRHTLQGHSSLRPETERLGVRESEQTKDERNFGDRKRLDYLVRGEKGIATGREGNRSSKRNQSLGYSLFSC